MIIKMMLFYANLVFFSCLFASVSSDLTVEEYNKLIDHYLEQSDKYEFPKDATSFVNGTYNEEGCDLHGFYNFIIVGAGSSGTVLANRLSEVKKWNVLLLEAGGDENEFTDIPGMFGVLGLTEFNWGYKTVPQKNSLKGFINNVGIIPRGKVLGGSSTINAMMYVRGNRLDYDEWGLQNPGWLYEDVLPYFKKSENSTLSSEDEGYHGHNGTLHVENVNILSPLPEAYLSANKELGETILDYNGKDEMGYSMLQTNTIKGRRCSGAKAFLKTAKDRKNLEVLTYSYVTKILIHDNIVYGVKFMRNGKTYCAYTTNEVILSAGTMNSAHLLMNSGIGPKKHLEEFGIKVVKDLPVGENVWDHNCVSLLYFTTNYTIQDETRNELLQQYLDGKGAYTTASSVQSLGFNSLYWGNKTRPDIEYIMRAAKMPIMSYDSYKKNLNYGRDIFDHILKKLEGQTVFQSMAILLNPESRGTIKLKSNNPFDFPLIDPNYFSDPSNSDINTMAEAIKHMIKLSKTAALQKYNVTFVDPDLPKCRKYKKGKKYYRCLVKNLGNTIYHYSGSAKMGPLSDKTSVVDPELRVHGMTGLRVADCSVIPVTISGHTNAPAYMIGEKAADIIKKFWLPKYDWKKMMGLLEKLKEKYWWKKNIIY